MQRQTDKTVLVRFIPDLTGVCKRSIALKVPDQPLRAAQEAAIAGIRHELALVLSHAARQKSNTQDSGKVLTCLGKHQTQADLIPTLPEMVTPGNFLEQRSYCKF